MVIEVFFGTMGYLAKADRLVTSHESDLANRFMDELDLSMAARRIASEAFERGMHRNINLQGELLRFTDAHPSGSEDSKRLYDVLVRLAASDSKLDQREYERHGADHPGARPAAGDAVRAAPGARTALIDLPASRPAAASAGSGGRSRTHRRA